MEESPLLREWVVQLRQGHQSDLEERAKFLAYYYPEPKMAENWSELGQSATDRAEASFEILLTALRLHDTPYVSMPGGPAVGSLEVPESFRDQLREGLALDFLIPYMYQPKYVPPEEEQYILHATDTRRLGELIQGVGLALGTRIAPGLRRYVASYEKESVDSFIDLLISLEVLYGDKDRAALGHKIAFRASTIVSPTTGARQRIFKAVKKAYDKRSTIIHGGASEKEWIDAHIGEIREFARESLKWFVAKVLETGSAPEGTDIDKICFDATPVQTIGA